MLLLRGKLDHWTWIILLKLLVVIIIMSPKKNPTHHHYQTRTILSPSLCRYCLLLLPQVHLQFLLLYPLVLSVNHHCHRGRVLLCLLRRSKRWQKWKRRSVFQRQLQVGWKFKVIKPFLLNITRFQLWWWRWRGTLWGNRPDKQGFHCHSL